MAISRIIEIREHFQVDMPKNKENKEKMKPKLVQFLLLFVEKGVAGRRSGLPCCLRETADESGLSTSDPAGCPSLSSDYFS